MVGGVYRGRRLGKQEWLTYAGSDCTGSDGATGRTLTLTKLVDIDTLVKVGKVLSTDTEYTQQGYAITFLGAIDNTDIIKVFI